MRKFVQSKIHVFTVIVLAAIVLLSAVTVQAKKDEQQGRSRKDIATIVSDNDNLSTLSDALKTAGVMEQLKEKGPYTLFAPTDEAFSKLPAGTLDDLLKPENKDKLISILTYHVAPGTITSEEAAKLIGKDLTMLNQKNVKITKQGDDLFMNGAKIIQKDIKTSNGVIHTIDAVLVPEEESTN